MAFTQTDLDRLESAIAKGERMVRFNDRTVEYRSVTELIAARDHVRAELQSSAAPRSRQIRLVHGGKGI